MTSNSNDKMAELCEGIAEVLGKRGHTVRTMEDRFGRVCLLGAGRVAQNGNLMFTEGMQGGPRQVADTKTSKALGFETPARVAEHNDGYIERTVKHVPIVHNLALVGGSEVQVADGTYDTITEEVVHPPLDKQQAIDLAMERAKYWRNQ